MAEIILIQGKSGSGKSTSLRNLDPKTTLLYQVIYKPLPFPGWNRVYTEGQNRKVIFKKDFLSASSHKEGYANASKELCESLKKIPTLKPEITTVIIDDAQYLMSYEYMARAKEKGYDKFTEIQMNFFNVIQTAQLLPDNITVVFLHHTDESDPNNIKAKTVGKMIDNSITLEGVFTIVLMSIARRENGKINYYFITHSDGTNTAKSPMGMFEDEIPNDLNKVLERIRDYNQQELKVA